MIKHLRVNGKATPSMVGCSSAVFSFSSDGATEQMYVVSLLETNGNRIAERVICANERSGFSFDVRLKEGMLYTWVVTNGREAAKGAFYTVSELHFPTVESPLPTSEPMVFLYSLLVPLNLKAAVFCFQTEGKPTVLVNGERLAKPERLICEQAAYMCCNLLPYLWCGEENTVELRAFGGANAKLCGGIVLTDVNGKRLTYSVDESWQVRTREGKLVRAVRIRSDG